MASTMRQGFEKALTVRAVERMLWRIGVDGLWRNIEVCRGYPAVLMPFEVGKVAFACAISMGLRETFRGVKWQLLFYTIARKRDPVRLSPWF